MREQRMVGRAFETPEKLKAEGWEYVLSYPFGILRVFKKGDRRIVWNSTTKYVEKEYKYVDQKLTIPPKEQLLMGRTISVYPPFFFKPITKLLV